MKKRLVSLLLVVCMSVGMLAGVTMSATASESSTVSDEQKNYAVVLRSAFDEATYETVVQLGFTDGSKATYAVSRYTDSLGNTYNLTKSDTGLVFAENAKVGNVVAYEVVDGMTVLTDAAVFQKDTSVRKKNNGIYASNYQNLWSTANTKIFLLYNEDTTDGTVYFKVYHLWDMIDFLGQAIHIYQADELTEVNGYSVLENEDGDMELAVITAGTSKPSNMLDAKSVGYIVDSTVAYDSETDTNYLDVTLIDVESKTLVSGAYRDVAETDYVGAAGDKQIYDPANGRNDPYAIGSIANYTYDETGFAVMKISEQGQVSSQKQRPEWNGSYQDGYYQVTIAKVGDSMLAFYPYGTVALGLDYSVAYSISLDNAVQTVAIKNNEPIGEEIATVGANETVTATDYNAIIEITSGSVRKIFSFHDTEEETLQVGLSTVDGAQIRTTGVQGLRFISNIDKTSADFDRVIEYGTLLIPSDDVSDISEVVIDAKLNGHSVAKVRADKIYEQTDTTIKFTAVLIDVPVSQYKRAITARAYAILDNGDVIYGDSHTSRSVYQVAQFGLQSETESEENKAVFREIIFASDNENALVYPW